MKRDRIYICYHNQFLDLYESNIHMLGIINLCSVKFNDNFLFIFFEHSLGALVPETEKI